MDKYIKTDEGFVNIRSILESDDGHLIVVEAGSLQAESVKPGADRQRLSEAIKTAKWIDIGPRRTLNPDAFAGVMVNGDTVEFYLATETPSLDGKYRFDGEQGRKVIAA